MAIDIGNETIPGREISHGWAVVGTTPQPLTNLSVRAAKGVLVVAPGNMAELNNTAVVFVGRKGMTADADPGTGGIPLAPGMSIGLPVDDPSTVYVVAAVEGQKLAWMCA